MCVCMCVCMFMCLGWKEWLSGSACPFLLMLLPSVTWEIINVSHFGAKIYLVPGHMTNVTIKSLKCYYFKIYFLIKNGSWNDHNLNYLLCSYNALCPGTGPGVVTPGLSGIWESGFCSRPLSQQVLPGRLSSVSGPFCISLKLRLQISFYSLPSCR